jgi:hypothetical protein
MRMPVRKVNNKVAGEEIEVEVEVEGKGTRRGDVILCGW